MSTGDGEGLGDASTNDFMEASFTIDKVTVTARTKRAMAWSTQWNLLKILKQFTV